jgi:hypothetical protein
VPLPTVLPKLPAPVPGTSLLPKVPGLADGGSTDLLSLLLGGLS